MRLDWMGLDSQRAPNVAYPCPADAKAILKTPDHHGRPGSGWSPVASWSNFKACLRLSSSARASWLQHHIRHAGCAGDAAVASLAGIGRQRVSLQRGRNEADACLTPAAERREAKGFRIQPAPPWGRLTGRYAEGVYSTRDERCGKSAR